MRQRFATPDALVIGFRRPTAEADPGRVNRSSHRPPAVCSQHEGTREENHALVNAARKGCRERLRGIRQIGIGAASVVEHCITGPLPAARWLMASTVAADSTFHGHMNQHGRHSGSGGRALKTIELELDENGSPVRLDADGWYVCFVPGLKKQWWHPFVNGRHKHVFAMKPAGPGDWTLFEPWWHRLLTTTITSEQARKFLLWGARGDVLHVREAIPGRGSQVRGWMTCAALASYLLGRPYWVWTPHGLYKRLLREPNVCRVDVSRLVRLNAAALAKASQVIMACDECKPGAPKRRPGAPKPFCMNCGRDLVELPESQAKNVVPLFDQAGSDPIGISRVRESPTHHTRQRANPNDSRRRTAAEAESEAPAAEASHGRSLSSPSTSAAEWRKTTDGARTDDKPQRGAPPFGSNG